MLEEEEKRQVANQTLVEGIKAEGVEEEEEIIEEEEVEEEEETQRVDGLM